MHPTKAQTGLSKTSAKGSSAQLPSPALEWIWHYLRDIQHPHILDCGAASAATINILVKREAKLYVADLVVPLQRNDSAYWRRDEKQLFFCLDKFLTLLPQIPPASLSLICAWHLLDFVPRDQLAGLMTPLTSLLEPGGVFFCLLRESNLSSGGGERWWLESLTTLGSSADNSRKFAYPPLSNREVERLADGGSIKTFLTRSHRREVVILKDGVT